MEQIQQCFVLIDGLVGGEFVIKGMVLADDDGMFDRCGHVFAPLIIIRSRGCD